MLSHKPEIQAQGSTTQQRVWMQCSGHLRVECLAGRVPKLCPSHTAGRSNRLQIQVTRRQADIGEIVTWNLEPLGLVMHTQVGVGRIVV